MAEEKYFPKGFIYKTPHDAAPDFVKGKVSIKVDEFKAYLSKVKGEWLNINLKVGKSGKAYAEVDTWKPDPSKKQELATTNANDDLPF